MQDPFKFTCLPGFLLPSSPLALLSPRDIFSLQGSWAQHKINGPAGTPRAGGHIRWAGIDPCSPTGLPSPTATAVPGSSPGASPQTHFCLSAQGFGDLLCCLLLHLRIKTQPSKNDRCPGEKGRELESSYSIQQHSTVHDLRSMATNGTLLPGLKPFWCKKTSLRTQEQHLAGICSPAGNSIHMKSQMICKEFSAL